MTHCTFVQNTATDSGGAIYIAPLALLSLHNVLAANNLSPKGPDIYGALSSGITSLGGNLIGDSTLCRISLLGSDQAGTFVNPIDPQLAPLGFYGGPTSTHFLEANSPAIDAGVGNPTTIDQRGIRRTAVADIGAFELHRVVLKAADSLQLCVGSPFTKMDSIVIVDSTGGAMHPGPSQALLLDLPKGFRLLPGQGNVIIQGNGLSNASLIISDSVVILFYDRSQAIGFQKIVISDLLIRASQAGMGPLIRRASNAVIIGDSPGDSLSHAFLSASDIAPPRPPDLNFAVCADTGEVPVAIPLRTPIPNNNLTVWYRSPDSVGISSLDTTAIFSNYQFTDTCFFVQHDPRNYFFYYSQIDTNSCESSPAEIEIDVNAIPNAPTSLFLADSFYCEKSESPVLQLVPNNGATYFWYDAGGTLLDSTILTSYELELSSLQFDADTQFVYSVTQKFNGCVSRDAQVFRIRGHANLPVSFEVDNLCLSDKTKFQAIAPPFATSYFWRLSDGLNNFSAPTSGPDTTIQLRNPGFKYISLTVTDSFGCESSFEDIIVTKNLTADFSWSRICEKDVTSFSAESTPLSDSLTIETPQGPLTLRDMISYSWDFGDTLTPTPGSNPIVTHQYPKADQYDVRMRVASNYLNLSGQIKEGCVNTMVNRMTILPVINPISGDTTYYDGFEDTARVMKQWISGGKLNNWEIATPADSILNQAYSGAYTWITDAANDYPDKMNAWVASPCYDLGQMKRPMLSIALATATEETFDGASIQYSFDGGFSWRLLGTVGSGMNWYTDIHLQSNPGFQENNRHKGWSGPLPWQTVRHRLDFDSLRVKADSLLRFRINMGADSSVRGEGIAFDNFSILERTSSVLIEQFVNQDVPEGVYALLDSNLKDIQYLQYHISYPDETDPIYVENQQGPDADARAYYYGISGPANIVLDGDPRLMPDYATLQQELDLKILQDLQFDIFIRDNGVGFSALQDVQRRIVLHVAVAENVLTPQQAYRYAVRKLFPNAGGTVIEEGLIAGEAKFVEVSWGNDDSPGPEIIPTARRDSLYLIAFVQDDVSKRIYDVAIRKASPQIFEGRISHNSDSTLRYAIFPNPTSHWLEVQLEKPAIQTIPCALYDLQGRRVLTHYLQEGDTRVRLDMETFAQGIYIWEMQLDAEIRREKVVKK